MVSKSRASLAAIALLALVSCNDDDGVGSDTQGSVLSGNLVQPASSQCTGCSVGPTEISFAILRANTAPEIVATVPVDTTGKYATGDLAPSFGDGLVILTVAGVGPGAVLGGAVPVKNGTIVKDFDVTTQIAGQAVVDMIAGTKFATGNAPDGCEVANDGVCETGQPCWFVLYEGFFDDRRIDLLEKGAALMADRVNLQTNVRSAACALINCTFEGAGEASQECLDGFFPPA